MNTRMKPVRRLTVILVAFLAGCSSWACTPQQAIHMTFGNPDAGGSSHLEGQATRVASCESEMNPRAVSPTNDHGLFQINRRYHEANFRRVTGRPWSDVYHPFWNAVYAKDLHDRSGWRPWTCQP